MHNNLSEELCSMSAAFSALLLVAMYWNWICNTLRRKKQRFDIRSYFKCSHITAVYISRLSAKQTKRPCDMP